MKNQVKTDPATTPSKDTLESLVDDGALLAPVDAKELARQRSKDDLARKRREMHQKRGKR